MAKKYTIEVEVIDGEIVVLEQNLKNVNEEFKKVGEEGEKSTSRYSGAIKKSHPAVEKLNSLTGGLVDTVLDLGDGVKKANVSFHGMKTALLATGIGAFIVALGLVVAYWDEIEDSITGATARLQSYLDLGNKQTGILEAQLALIDKQIESYKLQGKSTEALQKQKLELLNKSVELNKSQQGILKTQIARLKAVEHEIELTDILKGAWDFIKGGLSGVARGAEDEAIRRRKEIIDLEAALTGAETKAVDLEIALFRINNPEAAKGADSKGDGVERGPVQSVGSVTPEQSKIDAHMSYVQAIKDGTSDLLNFEALTAEERIALEYMVKDAKMAIASDTMGNLMGLMEEGSKGYKAVAIGQAIIDTYRGVTGAFASAAANPQTVLFPGFPLVQAGIALATGLKNVKKIISTKVGTKATGGGASGGSAAPAVPQASFNVVGNTGINQIGNTLNSQTDKPVKTYVTFGDIQSAEALERDAVRSSSV